MRAMAGFIVDIYTHLENMRKQLIKHFDKELPDKEDWHTQLLRRAMYPNEGVRPAIISESTYNVLHDLMSFRHKVRNIYQSNLNAERVKQLSKITLAILPGVKKDLANFIQSQGPAPDNDGSTKSQQGN